MPKITVSKLMHLLADNINAILARFMPGMGFTLMIFPFNELESVHYISNAERSTMILAMKDGIDQLTKQESENDGKEEKEKG